MYGLGILHWRRVLDEAERLDVSPESLVGDRARAPYRMSDVGFALVRLLAETQTRRDLLLLQSWSGADLTSELADLTFWGGELLYRFTQAEPELARRMNLPEDA